MIKMFIILFALIGIAYNYKSKRLISSASIWIACYVMIFILGPYTRKNIMHNAETINYFALIGIIAFIIGMYVLELISKNKFYFEKNIEKVPKYLILNKESFSTSYLFFWIVTILYFAVLVVMIGKEGVTGIINGELTSKKIALDDSIRISNIYVYIMHMMIPALLMTWFSAESKLQKKKRMICLVVYLILNVMFSFTRLFMISCVLIILLYEIRNLSEKRKVIYLIGIICMGVLAMVSLNMIRTWGVGNFKIENLFDVSYIMSSTDFGASYYYFSKILDRPSPYISPIVYLKPFFSIIPRSIWENKPQQLSMQVLLYLDPALAATGYSTAGNSVLGEGYAILGYIGIALFPFLWGIICTIADKGYYERINKQQDSSVKNILYFIFSTIIMLSAQRGDWSQYMTVILWFYMLPLYIIPRIRINKMKLKIYL